MKRRLLSLFMAMVMVCSLVPVALADTTSSTLQDSDWKNVPTDLPTGHKHSTEHSTTTPATCTTAGKITYTCGAEYTPTAGDNVSSPTSQEKKTCNATAEVTIEPLGHDFSSQNPQYVQIEGKHYIVCARAGCDAHAESGTECSSDKWVKTDDTKHWKVCTTCNQKFSEGTHTSTSWTQTATGHSGTCATCGAELSNVAHTYVNKKCTICGYEDPSTGYTITITNRYSDTIVVGDYTELTAIVKNPSGQAVTPYESVTWVSSSTSIATVSNGVVEAKKSGNVTITATCTPVEGGSKISKTYSLTVSSADLEPGVTVYDSNPGYALTDDPDEGSKSIVDRIDDWVYTRYKNDFDSYQVKFIDSEDDVDGGYLDADTGWYDEDDLDEVIFTPDTLSSSKKSDTISYRFTLRVYESSKPSDYKEYAGTMIFTVKEGTSASGGDIIYTAALGEDVYFDVSDFEDFFAEKYDELDYVVFGSSSTNGTLYNEDDKPAGTTTKYYVDPDGKEKGLDGIYFSPKSSMKKSTTVKISFTATGTRRSSSKQTIDLEGTVSIIYLNDSAKDITYSTTNGKVTLDPKDFEEAYKEATGSKTAPSGLTIEFQNVPTNGTLTYTGGSKDKDLTKSTVKSNRYTTKSSGSYRLAQLTYSGTKGKDTIDYIAYSGGTAQFSGKVVFNGTAAVPTDVVVGPFYSTAGQPAAFSQNTFTAASSAMSNAVKVRFVAPANGTLTMSGASAAGTDIAVSLLNLVSYQPKAGYNGTDQIIFAAYDAKNAVVASGTVNVQVIGNPTTTTPTTPGGSTGGVTDVSQFKDVASGAWYRDNLATLVKKGVISGKGEGKFDPKGTVTYGEALKMVLQACGYSAVAGTGSQWAINYKNLAVSRGWISNDIDLNAAISRNATAELAAKVLGVSPVTSGSPFADEANAYAVALYYTTPQIFVGTTNPNGGKPLFENNKPLLREQVCAVICRVMDYHTQHTTNTMPDGT